MRSTEHGGTYLSVTIKGQETSDYAIEIAHLEQLEAEFERWVQTPNHIRHDKVLSLEIVDGATLRVPISQIHSFCENTPEGREAHWARNMAIANRRAELYPGGYLDG